MKLKPCPFCGAFPAIYENRSEAVFTIECVNQMCRLQVKSYKCETEEAAIELWNTRAKKRRIGISTQTGFIRFAVTAAKLRSICRGSVQTVAQK